jgi:RNA-binding protein 5/10
MPVPAGPLGSEYLVQAARSGGMGSATIDDPDSQWVGYWHEQAGFEEMIPKLAPKICDNGTFELTTSLRGFLGHLSGPTSGQQVATSTEETAAPKVTGPISISMTGMQPIKIGAFAKGKRLEEEGFVASPVKNLLEGDDADVVGKDSVLLSRSE